MILHTIVGFYGHHVFQTSQSLDVQYILGCATLYALCALDLTPSNPCSDRAAEYILQALLGGHHHVAK